MTIITVFVLIIVCGVIEPCIFVESFYIVFSTAVLYLHPTFYRHIFLHNMQSIRIIRRKDIFPIRRSGQMNKRIFQDNRDDSWDQIWGIAGYLMWTGSVINGNGR